MTNSIPDYMPNDTDLSMASSDELFDEIQRRYDNGFIYLFQPLVIPKDMKPDPESEMDTFGKESHAKLFWGNAAELCTHLRVQAEFLETFFLHDTFGMYGDEDEDS